MILGESLTIFLSIITKDTLEWAPSLWMFYAMKFFLCFLGHSFNATMTMDANLRRKQEKIYTQTV